MGMLDGKVALVTGAGQGVGRGIALALAGEGAHIAVAGRTEGKLLETCAEIERRGGRAVPIVCDVMIAADIERCVQQTVSVLGTVDILINNAQVVPLGRLLDVTEEHYQEGMDSGPLATLRFMKACYPYLRDGGCIVNLGSSSAIRWDPIGYGAYAAAKEAIRALTRAAACEWGPDGIRVNCVTPGLIQTDITGGKLTPELKAKILEGIPLNRLGDAADVANCCLFLASDLSSYLTGVTLDVNGGMLIH